MTLSTGLLVKLIASVFMTLGFGVFFKMPPKLLPYSALGGTLVWIIYSVANQYTGSIVLATFVGAIFAAIFSNVFSVKKKEPRTTFLIPSIIFLLPGSGIYNAMLGIVYNDIDYTLAYGLETIKTTLAIAMGIAIVFVLPVFYKRSPKASIATREQYPEPTFFDTEANKKEEEERELMLRPVTDFDDFEEDDDYFISDKKETSDDIKPEINWPLI